MTGEVVVDLVICTRNRPQRVARTLQCLEDQLVLPRSIIIVDSSDSDATLDIATDSPLSNLIHVTSSPGLPRQRNLGVTVALAQHKKPTHIAFLDDDVLISEDYFANVQRIIEKCPSALGYGAYDTELPVKSAPFLHRILGFRALNDSGALLESGFAIPPHPRKSVEVVSWFPGHSMIWSMETFSHVMFDDSIRMYGEDLDFCLRAGQFGLLVCSNELHVQHVPESSGRDSVSASERFNAGFRWSLTEREDCKVSKCSVWWTSAILMSFYFLRAATRRDSDSFDRGLGLLQFFLNLIAGKRVTQKL